MTAGETYTFSAWVKTGTARAYLVFWDGSRQETSEILPANSDWTRLEVSYTATANGTIQPHLLTPDAGTVYMDCAQLEKAPTASRYNLVNNGDFRYGAVGWSAETSCTAADTVVSTTSAAPQLEGTAWSLTGSATGTKRVNQTVYVSGSAGDTLILSGWAKGDAVPYTDDDRKFGLILTFYNDEDEIIATDEVLFNPDTDSTVSWQYVSAPIVAEKDYAYVTVSLAYDYNANTALFDGIQLYKEQFGPSYTYDEDGNVISIKDLQGQTTTYEYDNNKLTKEILPTGATLQYTYYNNTHNVKTATTAEGLVYHFEYDGYGNNTKVYIEVGGNRISSSAEYENSGNTLKKTTDAAGNATTYKYNADTNVLEWVRYPGETETTQTAYTYDSMYRLTEVAATVSTGQNLTAEYIYLCQRSSDLHHHGKHHLRLHLRCL